MSKLIIITIILLQIVFLITSDSRAAAELVCNYGYKKFGMSCVKINVPHNAYIDSSTNDWKCNPGFVKNGNLCSKILLPNNALLNIQKNGWVCNEGYIKDDNTCRKMTASQKQKYDEKLVKKQIDLYNYRKDNLDIFGETCEQEYKTGATVCINNLSSRLDCSRSFSSDYYSDCSVKIQYDIETNYKGRSRIYSDVECSATISPQDRNSYINLSDKKSIGDDMISLFANQSERRSISIKYMPFLLFSEVTSVSLDAVQCELRRVYIY